MPIVEGTYRGLKGRHEKSVVGGGGLEVGSEGWRETVVNPRVRPHDFLPRNGCGCMRQGQLGNR